VITLLALKKILKKVWTWLRHNWYVPAVIVYTLVLWILFRKKDKAREVLEVRAESYEKQIEAINKSHDEEIKKRDEILTTYKDIVEQLEEEFEEDKKELDTKKKQEIKNIVKEYHDKPDELAALMAEKFGFIYEGNNE